MSESDPQRTYTLLTNLNQRPVKASIAVVEITKPYFAPNPLEVFAGKFNSLD